MDHENRFMNVNMGWPGSVHDTRILSNSEVFNTGEAGTLVSQSVQILAGVPVPVVTQHIHYCRGCSNITLVNISDNSD